MDEIIFSCPFCGTALMVEETLKGGLAQCFKCGSAVMVPGDDIAPGACIAGLEIEELLGAGGMGEVWLARHSITRRKVALKILSPALTADPLSIERFMNEVEISAKLEHPNIVSSIDAGSENGVYYFATRYIDGETLKRRLKREKAISEEEALLITLRISDALDYAWRSFSLVHGDVSPGNIMISWQGEVKLLDMGISKIIKDDNEAAHSGVIIGTPHYMSPEQAKAEPDIDCRSDIYSLGATLYHMVTGYYPFDAPNAITVLAKHLTEDIIPPHKRRPGLSRACSMLITSMMAKNRNDRPDGWPALMEEARKVLRGEEPSLTPPPKTAGINLKDSESQIIISRKIKKQPPRAHESTSRIKKNSDRKRKYRTSRRLKKVSSGHNVAKNNKVYKKTHENAKYYVMACFFFTAAFLLMAVSLFIYVKSRRAQKAAEVARAKLKKMSSGELTRSASPARAVMKSGSGQGPRLSTKGFPARD